MARSVSLTASLEDYLEAIFHLENKDKVARSKDIAGALGVARPSVTGALRTLAGKGLVNYEP
ncbi:MAG TPA: MarR family transcriptional regulator, partial [Phycisphaerales bacterium]|nr:MarR family transcriptional regulator [Phycisphaerales bacterium]